MVMGYSLKLPWLEPCPEQYPFSNDRQVHVPGRSACGGEIALFAAALPTMSTFPLFLNAYVCQQNFLPILAELDRPTPFRKAAVVVLSIGFSGIIYVLFASAGALTFGDGVDADILSSYPQNAVAGFARLCLVVMALCSVPIQVFPGRTSLLSLAEASGLCARQVVPVAVGAEAEERVFVSGTLPLLFTVLFMGAGTATALRVSDLGIAAALTGATGATMVAVLAPAGSYVLLHPEPRFGSKRLLAAAMFVAGLFVMVLSLILAFMPLSKI